MFTNIIKFLNLFKLKLPILSIILLLFNTVNIFAIDDGIYLVPTTTHYVNPETGEVDDIGSGNTALGEAMTRSALGETALLEVENGKTYLTFRLNLISNISNIKISTQSSKGGSYSTVSPTIKAENYSSDYADYRFEVKDLDYYICLEFYVAPMGRNVKFYASVDESKAVTGSGDFVTSIKVDSSNSSKSSEENNSTQTTLETTPSTNTNLTEEQTVSSNNSETSSKTTVTEQSTTTNNNNNTNNTNTATTNNNTQQQSTETTSTTSNQDKDNSSSEKESTSSVEKQETSQEEVDNTNSSEEELPSEENETDTTTENETDTNSYEKEATPVSSTTNTNTNTNKFNSNTSSSNILTTIGFIIIITIFIIAIVKYGKKR